MVLKMNEILVNITYVFGLKVEYSKRCNIIFYFYDDKRKSYKMEVFSSSNSRKSDFIILVLRKNVHNTIKLFYYWKTFV